MNISTRHSLCMIVSLVGSDCLFYNLDGVLDNKDLKKEGNEF